ncbi:F-box/kelch-repeat protein-like protein isoform X1 [Tanacetum coccineum]
MPEVRLNIVQEILARSQVEDLLRCKSVCKSWKSLISSRRFVKSHLNYNLKKKADNNEIGDTRIDFDSNNRLRYRLVGSSNGLVCIHDRDNDKFFVINPSTREVKELEKPPQDRAIEVSGFGYDSSIDDFKVVEGFYDGYYSYFFKVLTLKSNVWRSVAGKVDGYPLFKNGYKATA